MNFLVGDDAVGDFAAGLADGASGGGDVGVEGGGGDLELFGEPVDDVGFGGGVAVGDVVEVEVGVVGLEGGEDGGGGVFEVEEVEEEVASAWEFGGAFAKEVEEVVAVGAVKSSEAKDVGLGKGGFCAEEVFGFEEDFSGLGGFGSGGVFVYGAAIGLGVDGGAAGVDEFGGV